MLILINKGVILIIMEPTGIPGVIMIEIWERGEVVRAQTFQGIITQITLQITEIRMEGEIMEVIITGTAVLREVQTGIGGPEEILKGTSIPGGIWTGTEGLDTIMGIKGLGTIVGIKGLGTIMGIKGVRLPIIIKANAANGVGTKGVAVVTHKRQGAHKTGEIIGDKDLIMDIDRETRTGGTNARWFHQAG